MVPCDWWPVSRHVDAIYKTPTGGWNKNFNGSWGCGSLGANGTKNPLIKYELRLKFKCKWRQKIEYKRSDCLELKLNYDDS